MDYSFDRGWVRSASGGVAGVFRIEGDHEVTGVNATLCDEPGAAG